MVDYIVHLFKCILYLHRHLRMQENVCRMIALLLVESENAWLVSSRRSLVFTRRVVSSVAI